MSTRRTNHAQSKIRHVGWFVAISACPQLPSVALIRLLSRLLILTVLLSGVISGGLTLG